MLAQISFQKIIDIQRPLVTNSLEISHKIEFLVLKHQTCDKCFVAVIMFVFFECFFLNVFFECFFVMFKDFYNKTFVRKL